MAYVDVPNGQDTTSLGKTSFFGDTTDTLFKDRGDFGRSGLVGIAACLLDSSIAG